MSLAWFGEKIRFEGYPIYIEPSDSAKFKKIRKDFENDIEESKTSILMGVCRGKISEGLDFSDKAARTVIVVGIPYAVQYDPKVILKQKYLDQKSQKPGFSLKGQEWYQQEAS